MADPPQLTTVDAAVHVFDANGTSTQQYSVAPPLAAVPTLQLSESLLWSGPSVPVHE